MAPPNPCLKGKTWQAAAQSYPVQLWDNAPARCIIDSLEIIIIYLFLFDMEVKILTLTPPP